MAEEKPKKWIQKADLKEGAFTAKAKKAGMTVQAFAAYVLENKDRYDAKTVKQANLARTFKKMANAEEGIVVDGDTTYTASDFLNFVFENPDWDN
jgi:hypothetical protein